VLTLAPRVSSTIVVRGEQSEDLTSVSSSGLGVNTTPLQLASALTPPQEMAKTRAVQGIRRVQRLPFCFVAAGGRWIRRLCHERMRGRVRTQLGVRCSQRRQCWHLHMHVYPTTPKTVVKAVHQRNHCLRQCYCNRQRVAVAVLLLRRLRLLLLLQRMAQAVVVPAPTQQQERWRGANPSSSAASRSSTADWPAHASGLNLFGARERVEDTRTHKSRRISTDSLVRHATSRAFATPYRGHHLWFFYVVFPNSEGCVHIILIFLHRSTKIFCLFVCLLLLFKKNELLNNALRVKQVEPTRRTPARRCAVCLFVS
jgi:hypothetical protein